MTEITSQPSNPIFAKRLMIAVDTDILIYAHRMDSPNHVKASVALDKLIKGDELWAIPWPCVDEFISLVTLDKPYKPPSTLEQCFRALDRWRKSEHLKMIAESPGHYEKFKRLANVGKVNGPEVTKARVAAICVNHGVTELWTSVIDKYTMFPELNCRNPLENRP